MLSAQTHPDTHAGGSAYGIWPKLAALHNSGNPLGLLLQMARHHDGCIPLQMRSQRVFLITEAQHFKHVLQTNSANYTKYLDGMTPIFGGSMITMDGALWQKMRGIQQPAFHNWRAPASASTRSRSCVRRRNRPTPKRARHCAPRVFSIGSARAT